MATTLRTSSTNWTEGKSYLTVQADGMYAYAGANTPLAYYRSPTGGNVATNRSAYVAEAEAPDYNIQLPVNPFGQVFVRLDWDGHMRLYQWFDYSWGHSDILHINDPCAYPLSCGEYGICSNGQCKCPDVALGQSGLFEPINAREVNRGCLLTSSLTCGSTEKAGFLTVPNVTQFNFINSWTTNEEHCKLSCLYDCSCWASFFQHKNTSSGFCFLASDIFSMISVTAESYSSSYSYFGFVKIQESTHKSLLSKEKRAIVLLLLRRLIVLRRKRAEPLEDEYNIDQFPGLPTRFSFVDLKSATGDFSRKIGAGGFGSVFEGQIGDKNVAIKRLDGVSQGKMEFLAEVQTIGSINHKHLPENILLDDMFTAKISDFGLAKLIDREQSSVMTRLRGTVGYLAPEWLTSEITQKVDVYSFGVVIIEILCGRRNLDYSQPEESRHLVSMLQEKAKINQLMDLIDPCFIDMELHMDDVLRMMHLALWCLQVDNNRRPSMTMVVKILEGTTDVETELDFDLVNIDPMVVANRAAQRNTVTLQTDSVLSGPR
uniref:Protein kinase domain-containing protein n=1 Tax=Leersia perrieri TaxID=77586 RepID=A0A0D9WR42_9ORYZ